MMACYIPMYNKNHAPNIPYSQPHGWYPPYTQPHHSNNQYLSGPSGAGGGNGVGGAGSFNGSVLDNDAATAAYYNSHYMFHQASPDYSPHDSYAQNSSLLQSAMGPSSAALHLSQSIGGGLGGHNSSGDNNSSHGIQNVPPSPPITVNSGCSEMSSPGITNGGGVGNDGSSPHMGSNGGLSRPKSPYEWMKKPSYQSQPHPGKYYCM